MFNHKSVVVVVVITFNIIAISCGCQAGSFIVGNSIDVSTEVTDLDCVKVSRIVFGVCVVIKFIDVSATR